MTITREQLELAAKAAGVGVEFRPSAQQWIGGQKKPTVLTWAAYIVGTDTAWEPGADRGQLLDLAMACKICIDPIENEITYVTKSDLWLDRRQVDCQDFPALAEAVITAAAEQQLAKESNHVAP